MIAFPGMLVEAAERGNISVPHDPDMWMEHGDTHPHFKVFCAVQLCRPVVYHGEHWHNACVIGEMTTAEVKAVTLDDLISCGLSYST